MGGHKKQHYVQQSYLRRFSENPIQICVFDKALDRHFTNGIRDVAQESQFYRLPDGLLDEDGGPAGLDPLMIEKWFQTVEGDFNLDIEELVGLPEGSTVPRETRASLAGHIAIQYLRTRAFRNIIIDSAVQLVGKLNEETIRMNFGEEALEFAPKVEYSERAAGLMHIQQILNDELVGKLTEILSRHLWTILVNETERPFYTSDHPVALHNHLDRPGFRPGLGLRSLGIEVAFPLSSTRLLSLGDRSIMDPQFSAQDGGIRKADALNVEFYNSLQVLGSERQVFCEKPDWKLVEEMIEVNLKLRDRPSRVSVE